MHTREHGLAPLAVRPGFDKLGYIACAGQDANIDFIGVRVRVHRLRVYHQMSDFISM
jgi:hypothetical protein